MAMFPAMRVMDTDENGVPVWRDLKKMMATEFLAMERATGIKGAKAFMDELGDMNLNCVIALVWVARKRTEPTLAFSDVDVDLEAFDMQFYAECGKHEAKNARDEDGKLYELPCAECAAERGEPAPELVLDPTDAVEATAPASVSLPVDESAASDFHG